MSETKITVHPSDVTFMPITNWDEVLPAFEKAFEELRKIHLQSKDTALKFLEENGFLELSEDQEKDAAESTI